MAGVVQAEKVCEDFCNSLPKLLNKFQTCCLPTEKDNIGQFGQTLHEIIHSNDLISLLNFLPSSHQCCDKGEETSCNIESSQSAEAIQNTEMKTPHNNRGISIALVRQPYCLSNFFQAHYVYEIRHLLTSRAGPIPLYLQNLSFLI